MSVLKVSELSNYITKYLKLDYFINDLLVEGEVSNYNKHSSGNLFFSLKDENSKIDCFMSVVDTAEIELFPEEGDKIIVNGAVTFSEKSSKVIFVVRKFKLSGEGSLLRRFNILKEKLEKEGIFDSIYKKEIPKYPNKIGIVTSPTGAAITDILNVIKRRNKNIDIVIFPSLVQGDSARDEIIEGLLTLDEMGLDCLILARGGGSKEDLFVFNDEKIAKTIFNLKTPIISAIGHEIDYSISDYVSDLRAPTPSAAAELVSHKLSDMLNNIYDLKQKLDNLIYKEINFKKNKLHILKYNINSFSPISLLNENNHKLINHRNRLIWYINNRKSIDMLKIDQLNGLRNRFIIERINREKNNLKNFRLVDAFIKNNLYYNKDKLIYIKKKLDKYMQLEVSRVKQKNQIIYNKISYKNINFNLKKLAVDLNSNASKLKPNIVSMLKNQKFEIDILKTKLEIEHRKKVGIYKNGNIISSVSDVEVGNIIKSVLKDGIINLEVKNIEKMGEINGKS